MTLIGQNSREVIRGHSQVDEDQQPIPINWDKILVQLCPKIIVYWRVTADNMCHAIQSKYEWIKKWKKQRLLVDKND